MQEADYSGLLQRDWLVLASHAELSKESLQRAAETGTGAAAAVSEAINGELQCWVNRDEALLIASAAQAAFPEDHQHMGPFNVALAAVLGHEQQLARSIQLRCGQENVDRLYRATAYLLRGTLVSAIKEQLTALETKSAAASEHMRCVRSDAAREGRFDFAVSKSESETVKALRLRRLGIRADEVQLALVIRDQLAEVPVSESQCPGGEHEVMLGISANIGWDAAGQPSLAGRFGTPAIQIEPQQLSDAIASLLPIQGVTLSVDVQVGSGIVPIAVTTLLKIPGLPKAIPIPTVNIDPGKLNYGLNELISPVRFRDVLNKAIESELKESVLIPSLGIEVRSLRWLAVNGDSHAPVFEAVASARALKPFASEITVELYLAPASDRKSFRLALRPAVLPPVVVQRLASSVTEEINKVLVNLPDGTKFGRLESLQISSAVLGATGIKIESTLHFPDTMLDNLNISLDLSPDNPDLAGQISKQITNIETRLRSTLMQYVKQRMLQSTNMLAASAMNELRTRLGSSYSALGMSWSISNLQVDNSDVHGLCFDLVNEQQWAIEKVCTRELDSSNVPRLIWSRATLNDRLSEALAVQVAALSRIPYFGVKLISASLRSGRLVGNLSVTILDVDTAIPVVAELRSVSGNINDKAIEAAVIGAVRASLSDALKGREVTIGEFSLYEVTVPAFIARESDEKLTMKGKFNNGDWLSGEVEFELYPDFKVYNPNLHLGTALKRLFDFETVLPVEVEEVRTNPLMIRAGIKLSNIPFLSILGIKPTVHVEVPLRGPPRVIEPIEIALPGREVPIGPFFSLANPSITIYPKTIPMKFRATADLTVASGVMAKLIKVHATLIADLKAMRLEFTGPLTVLNSVELSRTEGTLDAKAAIANMRSSTSSFFAKIAPTQMTSSLNGRGCRFTQTVRGEIPLLRIKVAGNLVLQAPCGDNYDGCPHRGLGAVCITGHIDLGKLGDVEGALGATLAFKAPVAAARVRGLPLLGGFSPSIDVRVARGNVRASFTDLCLAF